MPSITLFINEYFPCGPVNDCNPLDCGTGILSVISHVSTDILTSSSVNVIGVLFNFVQCIRNDT